MSARYPREAVVLPSPPGEQRGWGRLSRIIRQFPTEPVELLIGFGNLARGLWVMWPGHHDGVPHFPSLERLALAFIMATAGALQLWATIEDKGKIRAGCGIVLTILLVYIGGLYASVTQRSDLYATIILFYGTMALGEFWIAGRTPAVIPIIRWSQCWRWFKARRRRKGPAVHD